MRPLNDTQRRTLEALVELPKKDRYAVGIQQFIEDRADLRIGLSTIWDTLETLDRRAYVGSKLGEATPERSGRRKRLYEVTSLGKTVLGDSRTVDLPQWLSVERPWMDRVMMWLVPALVVIHLALYVWLVEKFT